MELVFPCEVEVAILSDTPEACQHLFEVFPKFSLKRLKPLIRVRRGYGGQVSRI